MLSDRFIFRYRHPDRTPIQLILEEDRIRIDCRVRYNRRALVCDPTTGRSPADHIEDGIIEAWSGTYDLGLPDIGPVEVIVEIRRERDRRRVSIRMKHLLLMPAHVISPLYRRLWGILRNRHLESMGTNWSLTQPGTMLLPLDLGEAQLSRIAAHEAGHLFGLGDAYAAFYRFYDAVPGTEHYMMHSNRAVHPQEILMLLKAHDSGRMQYFPLRWNTRRFFTGLRQDLSLRIRDIGARLSARYSIRR